MKRIIILLFILIISNSCNKKSNLIEVTDSTENFKIEIPKEFDFEKTKDLNKSLIKFNDSSLIFQISGFKKKLNLNEQFYDSLKIFNRKNNLRRIKSDYFTLNDFKIYEQYAVGIDTLKNSKFSRIDYWLNKENDRYFILFSAEKKDTTFNDKDFELTENILKSIKRIE